MLLARPAEPPVPVAADGGESLAGPAAPALADAPPAPRDRAAPGPGTDAEAAAAGFLTAEATRDLETAFTYLHPDEQAVFGSPAGYVSAHADLLGPVTGFTVDRADPDPADPTRATVVATVGFEPSLDLVVGLIPATATATIPVVEGEDGWTVSLADTVFEPILPSDDRAAADAREYVVGAVACDLPPVGYGGALIGRPQIVAELCGATGDATVAGIAPLDDPVRVQPFLSAFGPDVTSWARVAEVTSPVALRLVLAPYGDAWTVIGVLPET